MPDRLSPEVIDQTPDVTPTDVLDLDALLTELAGLSPIAYEQRRASAAKLLGVRVGALDAEVATRRPRQAGSDGAGDDGAETAAAPLVAEVPVAWPDEVDGPQLLADLSAWYARFIVLPEGAADALALWTAHTYAVDAAQVTPRLAVVSPQPRCGKTTLIAMLGAATARPLSAANITASALFRAIEAWHPTMLIDEADTFLRDNEDLRGVLNAGHYRPTAYVIRSVPVGDSWEPRAFRVWGPVAIALIGSLPSTLADRSITVKLRRKTKHEQVERLRLDRLGDAAEPLRRRCLRWAQDALLALQATDPAMPDILHDRAADNWRPLCAIAEVAGGDWAQRAAHAIRALTPQELDDEAAGVLLLEDFQQLFITEHTDRLTSEAVVAALRKLEERPWSEWGHNEKPITARQVARLLSPFGIKSKTIRVGTETPKGYEREDFTDAWMRYVPLLCVTSPPSPTGISSATPPQVSNGAGFQPSLSATPPDPRSATPPQVSNDAGFHAPSSATASNSSSVADDDDRNPVLQADCGGVADRDKKPVADERARNPASDNGCGAVADHTPVFEAWQDEHISPGAHCPMGGHHTWLKRGEGRLCARCNVAEPSR